MEDKIFRYDKRETVETFYDMVYRLSYARTKNKEHAEDVTQDVFYRFLKTDKQFESMEHIKAWLIRVTVNCAKSLFLSSWFKKTQPLEENEDIPYEDPEQSDVLTAAQALPEKYRIVIHLFYYEDMSIEQISKTLDIKESTVKSQLHRAREMLKEKLKGGYDFV